MGKLARENARRRLAEFTKIGHCEDGTAPVCRICRGWFFGYGAAEISRHVAMHLREGVRTWEEFCKAAEAEDAAYEDEIVGAVREMVKSST